MGAAVVKLSAALLVSARIDDKAPVETSWDTTLSAKLLAPAR